ncbi:MAG: DUF4065 domain-containing protein [Bacilli bacterium]|nr:DUF4065 domain-containing protein [Bacilli bacterium]
MRCDNCNSNETYVKLYKHEYILKGQTISFEKERRFCKICNNLVYDSELDNNASLEAIRIYNKTYGITGEEIVNLRKEYSLNQETFSKIIGCAKKTLISYENSKSIPNDIYMITIKTLLDNPEIIIYLVESNKDRFETKEYDSIIQKIYKKFGPNIVQIKNEEKYIPNEYNGYTKLSFEKIKNLILILCKDSINKTKLLKEMFYCDFLHYKKNCSSITGLVYSKLNYGPVPDDYEKLLENYAMNGSIVYDYKIFNDYISTIISSNCEPNYNVFNKSELNIIEYIKKYFQDFNSQKIVEFSHKETAFTDTNYYKNISYDYAFDISLDI